MATKIMILNGPNLNFLGIREPHIYGSTTLEEIEASCQELAKYLGISISFHQSNLEGELVNLIQSAHGTADAIIMNPAAYSFTSIALIDALKISRKAKIGSISLNIHARRRTAPAFDLRRALPPLSSAVLVLTDISRPSGGRNGGKLPDTVPASLHGLGRAQSLNGYRRGEESGCAGFLAI
jgi:3-dehydroquinate dehydratase-2